MSVPSRQARVRGRDEPTHGRHCRCSACKQEDWTNPRLAPCGMHGPKCPRLYDPWPPAAPSRQGDEALDRLGTHIDTDGVVVPPKDAKDALATVRAEIERLREERDKWKWVARETADNLHSTIRIREQRAEAAEAEVQRLTEGLREIESLCVAGFHGPPPTPRLRNILRKARALLSASPSGGGGA